MRAIWLAVVMVIAMADRTIGAQQRPERMRVTADNVNLRTAPSLDSAIVRAVAKGTIVAVLARDAAWIKVQAPLAIGWLRSSQLVSLPPTDSSVAAPPATAQTVAGPHPEQPRVGSRVISKPTTETAHFAAPVILLAGANSSTATFSQSTPDQIGSHSGIAGGVMLAVPVATPLSIEFDPTYQDKGVTTSGSGGTLALTEAVVELPVQLRLSIGSAGRGILLSAGGHAAYQVGCSARRAVGAPPVPCDQDPVLADRAKADWGATAGGAIVWSAVTIGVRYDVGTRGTYTDGGLIGRGRSLMVYAGIVP